MRKVRFTPLAFGAIALPSGPKAEEAAAKAGLPADVEALIFRSGSRNSAAMLLVHGWGCDHTALMPQIDFFRRSHRVIKLRSVAQST